MTDSNITPNLEDAPHGPEGVALHGPNVQAYTVIAGALGIFTVVSFVVNAMVQYYGLPVVAGFLIILGVAVVKATLVTMYFMHVKYDWALLYFLLIPAFILATMMMLVLLPDIVFAWHSDLPVVPAEVSSPAPKH
jgi:caa(3)-type oxidase subunit IV